MFKLDDKVNVELTVGECVLLRNALRQYADSAYKDVCEALDNNSYAAAVVHEHAIAEMIQIFGKLCRE